MNAAGIAYAILSVSDGDGAPSGIVYSALMSKGVSFNEYENVVLYASG